MRRISSHIPLIAALVALCIGGQAVVSAAAIAANTGSTPTIDKAALNKAVQEALAKAKTGANTGAQGAAGVGGAAGAGGSSEGLGSSESLSKLTGPSGEEETTTPTTTTNTATNTASSGISTGILVPVFVLGALVLGGIAFFIMRDARSVAPVADGPRGGDSAQERAARLRKQRARAKAARAQRKRNR